MKIKLLNNRKKKRAYSNGFFIYKGKMCTGKKRKYISIGFFGFLLSINYGKFE